MGCASSSPLVESGKSAIDAAKEGVGDAIAKGEHALQDVGEKSKAEVMEGMDHVKEAVESAMSTVGSSIGSTVEKLEDTFHVTSAKAREAAQGAGEAVEGGAAGVADAVNEAVSEAETVLASEAEGAKDLVEGGANSALEKIDSAGLRLREAAAVADEQLQIEDMDEQFDMLGDNVEAAQARVEEIMHNLPTPAPSPAKRAPLEEE